MVIGTRPRLDRVASISFSPSSSPSDRGMWARRAMAAMIGVGKRMWPVGWTISFLARQPCLSRKLNQTFKEYEHTRLNDVATRFQRRSGVYFSIDPLRMQAGALAQQISVPGALFLRDGLSFTPNSSSAPIRLARVFRYGCSLIDYVSRKFVICIECFGCYKEAGRS